MPLPEAIVRDADFSTCRTWRYTLRRTWNIAKPKCLMILLNPSTADETVDDPTNRRGLVYAEKWGFGSLVFCNLFAFRTAYPAVLRKAPDPVGPDNTYWLLKEIGQAGLTVCAWGTHGTLRERDRAVLKLLSSWNLHALKITKEGHPGHILYLPGSLKPQLWKKAQ